jgi:hypothetical protein
MMSHINPLEVVLERFSGTDPAKIALFFWDEIQEWPSGTLDIFVKAGLLKPTQPMNVIECDGCEDKCSMPVVVYPAQEDKPGRAFINCDKRDDIGRVRVDFERMKQWQATGELIAASLVQLLGFAEPAKAMDGKRWNIGVLKGNATNKSLVLLAVEDSLKLLLAGYTIELAEVLTIEKNTLALDKKKLVRLVNDPVGNTESTEARQERLAARIKEEKSKMTKNYNEVVAAEEGISISRLKQILAPAKPAPIDPFAALHANNPSQKKTKTQY